MNYSINFLKTIKRVQIFWKDKLHNILQINNFCKISFIYLNLRWFSFKKKEKEKKDVCVPFHFFLLVI